MYLAFDTGGTKTRLGLSRDGQTIEKTVFLKTQTNDYAKALQEFKKAALELTGGEQIVAAAGGIPGTMDKEKNQILNAPNLPGWRGKNLRDDLQQLLHAPVYLENDTAVICLGEAMAGAGKGHRIVVYITVSTGIGGCRVVDQKVDANAMGFEPGHQVIDSTGATCACGSIGHLEAVAGGASLLKIHGTPPENIKDPKIWDKEAYNLACGLNNVIVFWSPDIVIIGGSIMKSLKLETVKQKVRDMISIYPQLPEFVPPVLGEEGGLLGGLALIKSQGL
ncbi:MAG: ROK family protein [Candidatus Andersenbacteria bacterium]|nr:ROK family protein [Candidatus Andersenbacteria bacterium]MBI3250934.1 ROK family protein [Candidatus Andersenbacteria bacterium]